MIRKIFHSIKFVWASVPVLVKLSMGRWYVFRDAPDWLVFEWATMGTEQVEGPIHDGIKQASEETARRVTRLISDCYAALEPINFNIDHPLVDDTEVIKASKDAVIRNNWSTK